MINFNNHRVWHECHNILAQIDANTLALKHLEKCHYQIQGYSDGKTVTLYHDSYQLPVTSYQLPVTSYQLPVTSYQLPVTSYQLPVTFHQ